MIDDLLHLSILISYFIIKLNIYSYNFGTKIKVEDKTTDWF